MDGGGGFLFICNISHWQYWIAESQMSNHNGQLKWKVCANSRIISDPVTHDACERSLRHLRPHSLCRLSTKSVANPGANY